MMVCLLLGIAARTPLRGKIHLYITLSWKKKKWETTVEVVLQHSLYREPLQMLATVPPTRRKLLWGTRLIAEPNGKKPGWERGILWPRS